MSLFDAHPDPRATDGAPMDAEIRELRALWQAARGAGACPEPDAIEPFALKPYLSRLFILEGRRVEDLRIRLAGTAYRELYGFEITGKSLLELIPADARPDVIEDYRTCLERGATPFHRGSMTWRGWGVAIDYERILLPYGDAEGVSRILGFGVFWSPKGRKLFK
jgi:hypothetical protein